MKKIIKTRKIKDPITEPLKIKTIVFGCDPEFFFEKKGKIIGSEKVIDINKGLTFNTNGSDSSFKKFQEKSRFIVDGVQAELNPRPDTCRARLGNEISQCFRELYKKIQEDKELSINFSPLIKISKEELDSLDDKSKRFGCSPSKNKDIKHQNAVQLVDPLKYKYRSAGGHIHIGIDDNYGGNDVKYIMNEPDRLVQILDILVGNTCVLIDRDPGNAERRKVYGRAGEYRTPSYGLEYRTLSNFWLKSYPLMSLVMNLTRFAVSIMTNSIPGRDYESELLSLINPKEITDAINNNDFNLAWNNFQKIKPFIARITKDDGYENDNYPLTVSSLPAFEFFVSKGIDFWFKENPLEHWMKIPEGHTCGWENFLKGTVTPQMMEENPTKAPKIK